MGEDDNGQTHLGDLSAAATIAIGILVGLLSTSIQSIGLTLQRKSHQLEDEKADEHIRRPPYRRRRWQIGMFIFVLANLVGSTIQITTLPLPVLSTLQASGLVFNTICASILLHEPFTRWSFIGTALIAGGAVLIALFGAVAEPSHNLAQHLEFLNRRPFVLWIIGTFLLIAIILVSILCINRIHRHSQPPILRLLRGFAFGAISSILSAHALLIAKSAVELLVRTIADQRNQFDRWQSWFILLLLVFFALSQLYFLHRGLKLVSTSVLYPFVFCIYNIIAILDGLIYFRQASRLPPLHAGLIAVGTVILLLGVFALSWRLGEQRYTAPPPEAHNLLTPGMGLVEDTTTEDENDIDADNSSINSADVESGVTSPKDPPSERTPLLRQARQRPSLRLAMPPRDHQSLHVSKSRWTQDSTAQTPLSFRRTTATDAADIWDELQDSHPTPMSTSRIFSHQMNSPVAYFQRRASTIGPGGRRVRTHFTAEEQPRRSSPSDIEEEGDTQHKLSKVHPNGSRSRSPARTNGRTTTKDTDPATAAPRKRSKTIASGPAGATEIRASTDTRNTRRQPTVSWRDRDRQRRRRSGWSGAGPGGAAAPSSSSGNRRSTSTPLSSTSAGLARDTHTQTSSSEFPVTGARRPSRQSGAEAEAGPATGGRRATSLGTWIFSLLPGRGRQLHDSRNDAENNSSSNSRNI